MDLDIIISPLHYISTHPSIIIAFVTTYACSDDWQDPARQKQGLRGELTKKDSYARLYTIYKPNLTPCFGHTFTHLNR